MLDRKHAGHCRSRTTPPALPASWAARNREIVDRHRAACCSSPPPLTRANNRITARTLGMRTEASGRFEKGVCAAGAMEALERACMLVNMLELRQGGAPGRSTAIPTRSAPRYCGRPAWSASAASTGVRVPGEQHGGYPQRPEHQHRRWRATCSPARPPPGVRISKPKRTSPKKFCAWCGYEHIPSTLMQRRNDAAATACDKQKLHCPRADASWWAWACFEILNYSFISPSGTTRCACRRMIRCA